MRLKQLSVYSWRGDGKYDGSVEFVGDTGEVKLTLDQSLSRRVIEVCADEIVAATKRAAQAMTAETLIASVNPSLEDKTA